MTNNPQSRPGHYPMTAELWAELCAAHNANEIMEITQRSRPTVSAWSTQFQIWPIQVPHHTKRPGYVEKKSQSRRREFNAAVEPNDFVCSTSRRLPVSNPSSSSLVCCYYTGTRDIHCHRQTS